MTLGWNIPGIVLYKISVFVLIRKPRHVHYVQREVLKRRTYGKIKTNTFLK
jgi:hypothetical protein